MPDFPSYTPFGLEPDAFWDDPYGPLLWVGGDLARERFTGVKIDAPPLVPLDRRQSAPVVAMQVGSPSDVTRYPFETQAVLLVADVAENRVYVAHAVDPSPPEDEEPAYDDHPDERDFDDGSIDSVPFVIDLRDRLNLPWRRADLLVTIALRDRLSNRVRMRLGKSDQAFDDPAVADFLAAEQAKRSPKTVAPAPAGRSLPSFSASDASPPVPEQPGVNVQSERIVVTREDARWMVHGSFRLAPLPHEIVSGTEDTLHNSLYGLAGQGPTPTAVVAITMAVVGADDGNLAVVRIHAPSFDPVVADGNVTGHFALDLFEVEGMMREEQAYHLFVLSGPHLRGPHLVSLVSEGTLPAGE